MINKVPQIAIVYNRHKTASSSRKASVEIRITYNYRQKYISTGIMLYPGQWKKGKVTGPDAMELNRLLDNMLSEVRQAIYTMIEEGSVDIFQIPERIRKKKEGRISFLEYCNQRAEIRKYRKAKDSQERYNRFLRLFSQWGRIREFSDVSESTILAYDKYLSERGMKNYSKWNNYHRFLNSFILDAVADGLLDRNPYRWLNIEKDKSMGGIGKYLSPDEFKKIRKADLSTESLRRVRDLFVFQTYTCLSYADLRDFDPDRIKDIKGMKAYVSSRQKTEKPFTIPLVREALDILKKYNNKLPVISNVKYNQYLKVVAQSAGIDKPISSHWARHTGATLLLNKGMDMKIISRICGHSSTRITEQVYAKLLDETVVEAMWALKGK